MKKCVTDKLVHLHHFTDEEIKTQRNFPRSVLLKRKSIHNYLMVKLGPEFKSVFFLED